MHSLPRIQDLSAEEIARLLEQQGQQVPATLLADLKVLMDEMGGIDNERAAVKAPSPLNKAA